MVGAGAAARGGGAEGTNAPAVMTDDDIFRQMVGAGADGGTH
jgi:hypothetical protein